MLQITAEEINFILYQYLQESGFTHSAYTFGKESNIIENKYRHFHIPAGMLIVFLEKALTLIHIETHYNEGDDMVVCNEPFTLLNPHHGSMKMSVKKPGVQNQPSLGQNPLESIMNNPSRQADNKNAENLDKEMEDESKNEHGYDMPESVMSKSKGMASHGASYSRQSTFLQDSGSKIKILESSSDKTLKVAWNPKNHLLAFGGDKEGAYLWDMDESLENAVSVNTLPHVTPDTSTSTMTQEKTMITSIDWKPDGNMFITAASDGICRLWSAKGEASVVMYNEIAMPLKNKDQIGGPFGPNGTTDSLQYNQISQGDIDTIFDCKWNKDGSAIVTVSEKNNVILWNTEGKLRASYQGHTDSVVAIDWKNNNMFATAAQDGVIKIWDVQSSSAIKTYNAHDSNIRGIKWDHTGALLASGGEDCTIKIWSQKHDKPILTFHENKEMIHSLKWSPTGKGTNLESLDVRLASGSADGTIKIWNVSEGKGVDTLQGHTGMVMCLDYDPTYKYLVSGDDAGRIIIWSVKDGTIIKTFENKNKKGIFDAQWSYDGVMLATGYKDVSVIDIRYM